MPPCLSSVATGLGPALGRIEIPRRCTCTCCARARASQLRVSVRSFDHSCESRFTSALSFTAHETLARLSCQRQHSV
eukprot:1963416-Alexandrium_andersonii.AAC.1